MNVFPKKMDRQSAILVLSVLALVTVGYFLFRNLGIRADVTSSGATLKVVVNDELGVPLDQAQVSVTSDQTNQTTVLTQKTSDGAYTATVGPGTFTIEAQAPGYATDNQPTSIDTGQTQEINFYLHKQ